MKPPDDGWYCRTTLQLVTPGNISRIVDLAIDAKIIGVDAETRPRPGISYSGLDVRPYPGKLEDTRSVLAGLAIAVSQTEAYYAPLAHDAGNLDPDLALREFRRLGAAIKAGCITCVFWHAAFDHAMLSRLLDIQAWPSGSFVDGEILDRFLRPHAHNHGLKNAVGATLGLKMREFEAPRREVWVPEIADHPLFEPRDNMALDFGAAAPEDKVQYAAGDALCTLRYGLAAARKNLKEDTCDLISVEHEFVAAVRAMPNSQIGYDREHVKQLADKYIAVRQFCAELLADFGVTKPGSVPCIARLLSAHGYRGDSTDKRALKKIPFEQAHLRGLAALVSEYRRANHYITGYLAPIINADHPTELMGTWSASGAKSGRMSAGLAKNKRTKEQHVFATYMPHGQPKTEEFRHIFVARCDPDTRRVIIKADYQSQEYRVCAVLANATKWIEVFNDPDPKKQDVHALTARVLYPDDYERVDDATRDKYRSIGKVFNFAAIYGAAAEGIANIIGCSTERAQYLLDQFYAGEPALRVFQAECQSQAKLYGRVYTYFGRPISVRASDTVDGDEETEVHAAPNYKIQGSCGDILKIAVTEFFRRERSSIRALGGDDSVRLVNLIHDEVVLEVDARKADEIASVLRDCMTGAAPASWPLRLPVEIKIGDRWSA